MLKNTDTYTKLRDNVQGFITNYKTDLTKIDRMFINKNPNQKMIHITRDSGTHLIEMIKASEYPANGEYVKYLFGTANREQILKDNINHINNVFRAFGEKSIKAINYFNGVKWVKVTRGKAQTILDVYGKDIRIQWNTRDRL